MVSVLLMEKLDLVIGCHHKKVTVFKWNIYFNPYIYSSVEFDLKSEMRILTVGFARDCITRFVESS